MQGELYLVMSERDLQGRGQRTPRVDAGKALQGNLDPALLLAPWDVIAERADDVLTRGRTAEGHI